MLVCISSTQCVVLSLTQGIHKSLLGLCDWSHTSLQGFCGYPGGVKPGKYGFGYCSLGSPWVDGNEYWPLIDQGSVIPPPLVPWRCNCGKPMYPHVMQLPSSLPGIFPNIPYEEWPWEHPSHILQLPSHNIFLASAACSLLYIIQ